MSRWFAVPRPATALATIAIFLALGGTAWHATT